MKLFCKSGRSLRPLVSPVIHKKIAPPLFHVEKPCIHIILPSDVSI